MTKAEVVEELIGKQEKRKRSKRQEKMEKYAWAIEVTLQMEIGGEIKQQL